VQKSLGCFSRLVIALSDSFVRNPRPIRGGGDARVFTATKAPISTERVRAIVAALDGEAGRSAAGNSPPRSDNLEYLTDDLKAAGSDLCTVAGGHGDDLLRRLMLALDLDPYELALSDPALLRHLRRRCALCQSREDCASDLARASAGQAWQGRDDWRDYCENALALEMLIALRSRSKAAPKYQCPYIA